MAGISKNNKKNEKEIQSVNTDGQSNIVNGQTEEELDFTNEFGEFDFLEVREYRKKLNPELYPELDRVFQAPRGMFGDLVRSWWGKFFCANLERNIQENLSRLYRGRNLAYWEGVKDIIIDKGRITAFVKEGTVYHKVMIKVPVLDEDKIYTMLLNNPGKAIDINELNKQIPLAMKPLFSFTSDGLLPCTHDMTFSCTCNDWADMCMHSAAALYCFAIVFDRDPLKFFTLRGIDISTIVKASFSDNLASLLTGPADSERLIPDWEVGTIFDLDLI